jgi:hypothetical protein
MHRAMVNWLPSWMVIVVIMVGLTALAFMFYYSLRRYLPKHVVETESPGFGVMGASYGFLLGFTISILWQNYVYAVGVTLSEASALNNIVTNILALAPADQTKLIAAVQNYLTILKDVEWAEMCYGRSAPEAWAALYNISDVMSTVTPTGTFAKNSYKGIVYLLDEVAKNRAMRINAIQTILPVGIRGLLIAGAIYIVFAVTERQSKSKVSHVIAMLAVCFLLAFNIGLAFILAYPFSSDVGISGKVLIDDIPARIKTLEHAPMELKMAPMEHEGMKM